MSSGGGSAPTHTTQDITQTTSDIPAYAKPYFQRLMDRAEGLSTTDYVPYGGQRIAGQSGDTLAGQDLARGIAGQGIAGMADAQGAAGYGMNQGRAIADQAANPFQFSQSQFSQGPVSEGMYDQTQLFTPEAADAYMSPYIQNVLDRQMNEQRRQFDINQGARNAASVQAGAFGGSRQGVEQALARADLERQQGDTYAQGLQSAYGDAQNMFGQDRSALFSREGAQMDERARAQGLNVDELGRVQAGTATDAARVQEAQAAENARAQQMQMDALGFSTDQAGQMLGFGEMDRSTGIQNAQLLEALGQTEDARTQAGLDLGYQDFVAQQAYPEQQLQTMSSIIKGVPITPQSTTTAYAPQGNSMQEALGMGLQGIGLYQGLNS